MPDFISEIEAALASNSPIPKDEVLKWIAAAGNDLRSLAKLNLLTNVAYYRIQPELGKETTCALIQRSEGVGNNRGRRTRCHRFLSEKRSGVAQCYRDRFSRARTGDSRSQAVLRVLVPR